MIIGLTGFFNSPFGEVSEYLRDTYGAQVINLMTKFKVKNMDELMQIDPKVYKAQILQIRNKEVTLNYFKNFVIYPITSIEFHEHFRQKTFPHLFEYRVWNYYYLIDIECSLKTRYNNYLNLLHLDDDIKDKQIKKLTQNDKSNEEETDDQQQSNSLTKKDERMTLAQFIDYDQQLTSIIQQAGQKIYIKHYQNKSQLFSQLDKINNFYQSQITRPKWDIYFMKLANLTASRSNCMKRMVGAVVIKKFRVVATGYNGTPFGSLNCNQGGCQRCNEGASAGVALDSCVCIHAQANAILHSGQQDKCKGGTIYVTTFPCIACATHIINSKISKVVFMLDYASNESMEKLKKNNIEVVKMKANIEW